MDVNVTVAIISLVGVVLSAWIGYMGSKKGTLASAEKDFRATILEENAKQRQRIEELERQIAKYHRLLLKSGIAVDDEDDE